MSASTYGEPLVIEDFDARAPEAGERWRVFSDRVMGGVSVPEAAIVGLGGRRCLRLRGRVRLDNNGGFLQAAVQLAPTGTLDASAYAGVELDVLGNGERYAVHLRTSDLVRPWQYYSATFATLGEWRTVRLPFAAFSPNGMRTPLATARLTRLGLVASGREFDADLCVAAVRLYRDDPS